MDLSLSFVFLCVFLIVFFNLCVCVFLLISCIFLGVSPHDKTFLCFWGKCRIKYVYIKKKNTVWHKSTLLFCNENKILNLIYCDQLTVQKDNVNLSLSTIYQSYESL